MMNPNQPNMMYQPVNIPPQISNYEGDIMQMIEVFKGFEKTLESFVQVNMIYHDQEAEIRTDSIDGLHPDYNHKMRFTIKPKDGKEFFSRDELVKCTGNFYFTLNDEIRTEEKIQERDANTYIYRYEKKFLGSFQIPFTTVLQNAALLETVCKVNIPPTVFGYYSDTSSTFDMLNNKEDDLRGGKDPDNMNSKSSFRLYDNVDRIVNPFINTYISLYVTVDPVPGFSESDDIDYVPGFEDSVFLINTSKWLKNLKANSFIAQRNIRVLAENFDGYSVFMPRYIRVDGQKPPEIVFDEVNNPSDEYSIEKAARYVSLIPFVEDSHAFDHEEMPDCWCTDEQFLALGFGDYEEHAVLLCNYFNYIDRLQKRSVSSYLVLGKGYPEGETTYVMRVSLNTPDVEFWNARTGECFYFDKRFNDNKFLCLTISRTYNFSRSTASVLCSLKEIGCVITQDNVYVNMQISADPSIIDLNVKNEEAWKPFLNEASRKKYFPNGIATIQKDLEYEYTSSEEAYDLTNKIHEHIKSQIEICRFSLDNAGKPLRTRWERTANDKIQKILSDYDLFQFTQKQSGINVIF